LAKKRRQSDIRKPVTTRQLTRKEREKKVQRIVIIVSVVVLLIAIGLVGYGYYDSQYKPYNETILEVNDTKVNMDYYLTMMTAYLQGADAGKVETIARAIPGAIINNLIIIQRAPDLGYTVSEEEINKAIAERNLPNEKPYRDIYASGVLTGQLETEYFGKELPESVDQVKVMAMVVDSLGAAESVFEGMKATQPFFELVEKFGVESISNGKSGNLGWLPKGLTERILGYEDATVLEKVAFGLEPGELSEAVYDPNIMKDSGFWILKVTEKDGTDSCRTFGILVGSIVEANEVKAHLEAGEDFSTLAEEYSQDENSRQDGGDLGWLRRGYTSAVLGEVFNMDIGQISDPLHDTTVQTKGGYWIVEAIEKEAGKPLDEEIRTKLINEDMMAWILEQTESSNINNYLTDTQQKWAINKAVSKAGIRG
jgi:hypothetical protein